MKNTLIFDFDGTLYDSYEGVMLAFNQSSVQLFKEENLLNRCQIGPKLKDLYLKAFENRYLDYFSKFEDLFRQKYYHEYYKIGQLYECVEELLDFFYEQGYEMYIVSNKPQKILLKTVEELKLTKFFKSIVGSDNDGNKIEKLNRIIESYIMNKEICFVLGDTIEDFDMAKSNNCIFIHAKYGYGQINESCISIDSIQDLKEIILFYK